MAIDLQTILNTIATDVFRRQADCDYISARMNYKMKLREQFLWSAQQTMEKYLKAILLYNGLSARYYREPPNPKEYGHDLLLLHERVLQIDVIDFQLPEWIAAFLSYLNELGVNRYLTLPTYLSGDELPKLDESVWSIRRYCQYLPDRGLRKKKAALGLREAYAKRLNSPRYSEHPTGFKIHAGQLEEILSRDHNDFARKALIWNNLYYGRKNRLQVSYSALSSFEIPPHHRRWFQQEANQKLVEKYVRLR